MARSPSLHRSLTLRYVLALTLVGCLATAAFLFLHGVILRHENEAAVVNLAGRQRMLSQRITLAASHAAMTQEREERQSWTAEMTAALDLMDLSHQALTQGNRALGIPPDLAATLAQMYAAEPLRVSDQVARFLANGRDFLKPGATDAERSRAYGSIIEQSSVVLSGLDDVVGRYQSEVERRVRTLETMEAGVWLGTLIILALEAALIFRPMIRRVAQSLEVEENRRTAAERRSFSDQRKTETLVDTIADAVVIVDESGIVQTFSPSAERMFGWTRDEIVGLSIDLLMPPDQRGRHGQILRRFLDDPSARRGGASIEVAAERRDGSRFPAELALGAWQDGDRQFLTAVVRDITQRKAIEDSMRRTQKMEVVGQLSGGVAHDFNNLLGIISGNLEILDDATPPGSRLKRRIEIARHATVRGADLTRKLLTFSGNRVSNPELVDLNLLIRSSQSLLDRLQTDRVSVVLDLSDSLPAVRLDPGEFEDALLNLALNARDAMPDGGTLTIITRIEEDRVAVHIADTGQGIPEALRAKIFEPFFTTKPAGKGTGLGLASVDGFVRHAGASVEVLPNLPQGTIFRFLFPTAPGDAIPRNESGTAAATGTETLLIVDDEEELRTLAAEQLETLGYRCLTAGDGASALQLVETEPSIALLASDVIMPGDFDGIELAARAVRLRPGLKLLLITGYAGRTEALARSQLPAALFLSKPFTGAELAEAVRKALDGQTREMAEP